MRRFFFLLALGCLVLLIPGGIHAQCSNFGANYPQGVFTMDNQNWQTATTCAYGGDYQRFDIIQGATYQFRTCGGTFFNSEITLWDAAHTTVLDYETNNCGNQGRITWQATFTGEVHLLVTQNGCNSNTRCARVQYRMRLLPPPPSNNTPCNALSIDVGANCAFEEVIQAGSTSSGVSSPSCGNYNGDDVWYQAIVPASGAMIFSTSEGSITDAAMAIYGGTCGSLNQLACNDDTNDLMPEIQQSGLTPGSTVFIRLYSYNNNETGTLNLCVYELCSSAPSNDLPCNAQSLVLGSSVSGSNDCSGSAGESWVPSCWTNGAVNSVWYAFTAPIGGEVSITTSPIGSMVPQTAVFSGDCSNLSEIACTQTPGSGCGISTAPSYVVSGLTAGTQYYLMVDGQQDLVGIFDVVVSSQGLISTLTGSDCASPIQTCSDLILYANPGPQGTGSSCDFTGANNCTGGEGNSAWYQINIAANGNLNFTIAPNDATNGSCGSETDYDFLLWKISGQGQTTDCSGISNNASLGLLACNYSGYGVTGIANSGNSPGSYSNCFNSAFEPSVSVTNGDILLLVVQNYNGNSTGFSIDLSGSDPGVIETGAPSTVYWNGGVDTDWSDSGNWGSCAVIPGCTMNAIIPASASSNPTLQGSQSVGNLTIESGAILVLEAGAQLSVCGDFINYGGIVIDPTATLTFNNGSLNQSLSGNLAGSNALGNLTIQKTGGIVSLNSTLEVLGDFHTQDLTSVFMTNDHDVSIGGDFNNAVGSITYRGVGTMSSLTFNGSGTQQYEQGVLALNLNHVILDKPGGRLELLSDLRVKNTTGSLTLNNGVIETGSRKVFIRNPLETALNAGNTNSYIEGNLDRYVAQTGLFHFPVGHASTGYQRADLTFRSHGFSYLSVTHSPWGIVAGPLDVMDCAAGFNLDALDNGYFTLTANTNPGQSDYDISLYNYNYANNLSAQGWTVMKDSGEGWHLDGNCDNSSTAAVAHRTNLSGFSRFATTQASNPLPIELLNFSGKEIQDGNLIEWTTATEIDNQGFVVESSKDAISFIPLGEIEGSGNSNQMEYYSFLDRTASSGLTYYRLLQIDYNGNTEYSNIIAVERSGEDVHISIFPNPVQDILSIQIGNDELEIERIELVDVVGKVVWIKSFLSYDFSKSRYELTLSDVKPGHYAIKLIGSGGQIKHQEVIVKH